MFIRHYSVTARLLPISDINYQYTFSSGRTLQFFKTPYCHSGGSIVTFDPKSGILFTSDLFGGLGPEWELFLKLGPECRDCVDSKQCLQKRSNCPINDIINFHKIVMPSRKALRYSLEQILDIPFTMIAPQHGSIISDKELMHTVFQVLTTQEEVGIDGIVENGYVFNSNHLRERFK
jgi:flavorubredoxin